MQATKDKDSYKICSKLRPFSNYYFGNYTRLFGDQLWLQNRILQWSLKQSIQLYIYVRNLNIVIPHEICKLIFLKIDIRDIGVK